MVQRQIGSETEGHKGVPPIVHEVLRSPGQPLESSARHIMERRFGHDFSRVRVHVDAKAAESAQSVNALAYTAGRNVVFGAGTYVPATYEGRRLIAHEMAHVRQQEDQSAISIQRENGSSAGKTKDHRFSAEGVSVVVRRGCATSLGFEVVEAGTRTALGWIFNSECIERSRRISIQRNLTAHGLDIRCGPLTNASAEATGFFIPANIMTLNSDRTNCPSIEADVIHEIVHLTRGVYTENMPESCESSCAGVAGSVGPELCRETDVHGRRILRTP
jgi:hypothetical protein